MPHERFEIGWRGNDGRRNLGQELIGCGLDRGVEHLDLADREHRALQAQHVGVDATLVSPPPDVAQHAKQDRPGDDPTRLDDRNASDRSDQCLDPEAHPFRLVQHDAPIPCGLSAARQRTLVAQRCGARLVLL